MKLLIKNGTIINSNQEDFKGKGDILVDCDKGIIEEIEEKIEIADKSHPIDIIDVKGLSVLPGLFDMHCHLREPGLEYKEDIESGTAAAAMGGFTAVACMPNTNPVADNEQVIKYILNRGKNEGYVKIHPIGAITKGLKGEELAEIGELQFAGAVAISDDGKPVISASLMKKAMMYAKTFEIPVISHCENLNLVDGGDMNEGYVSMELGLRGIPAIAESTQVAREVLLSEYTGVPIHIAHVSTASSINIIRDAKKRGVQVTCETCPHYFTLTDEACRGYNTNAKMNPPLATQKDVEAVKQALADGTIDVIATDHAPHHLDEKNVEFSAAANGIIGFETAFGLAYTNLVEHGILTIEQLVEKMSVNPSNILKTDFAGILKPGSPADITIVDTEKVYTVDINVFQSKSKNSPFHGYPLKGSVMYTIVNGRVVVRYGVLLG